MLTLFLSLGLILAVNLPTAAAAAPAPFSYVASPLAIADTEPTGISCLPGFCVGVDYDGDVYLTSGTKAVKVATTNRYLFAISCPSLSFCVAVGNSDEVTLTTINITERPLTAGPKTYVHWESVSCISARFCVAGGGVTNGPHSGAGVVSFWNGSSWTRAKVIAPFLPDNTHTFIDSISCMRMTFCVAADGNNRVYQWNGKVWSSVHELELVADTYNLSCTSIRFCVALGESSTFATWNGHKWAFQTGPTGEQTPSGMSCSSPTFCMSIDAYGHAESWNGRAWSALETVDPNQFLNTVSCSRAFQCEAVDDQNNVVYFTDAGRPPSIPDVCPPGECVGSRFGLASFPR